MVPNYAAMTRLLILTWSTATKLIVNLLCDF